MSNAPIDLKYSAEHQWAHLENDGTITVGITDYAQETLGDIVFIQMPELDSNVTAGTEIATVESVKTASEIFAPMSGKIISINQTIIDAPELINEDAYKAWLFKIHPSNISEYEDLLSAENYLSSAT